MDGVLKHQKPVKRLRPSFLGSGHSRRMVPVVTSIKDILVWMDRLRYSPMALKMGGLFCLGAVLFVLGYLVSTAIKVSDLPREYVVGNLSSENAAQEDVFLGETEQVEGTGAGTQEEDRTIDFNYRIRPGETLSEIAYAYKIPYEVVAYYNNISNVNRIREGMVITIPSLENLKLAEQALAKRPPKTPPPTRVTTKYVKIDYEIRNNGTGVTVQFFIVNPLPEDLLAFEWDFGDGKKGFRPNPSYDYSSPKTYIARLTARDAAGNLYKSNPLYVDIPHPGAVADQSSTRFITLGSPDEYFVVNGTITGVARYPTIDAAPLDISESDQFFTKVRFEKPGFYGISVEEAGHAGQYYSVFVSPIPTIHADATEVNFNWYRTQYNTGTTSNCGPASASMAIGWGLGKYFPVSAVRQAVGWRGDGGTSFEELIKVIRNQGIAASIQPLQSVQHIMEVIDTGSIAIAVFRTDGVKTSRLDPATNLFDKYYNDTVGHYIVIKGYSLNGEYLVIHDPIPSDWGTNSFRYGDEISMIGRNRYYATTELLKSLRRTDMIVVPRQNY
ncbi:MAG: LysM peptidoglycan-binding domain-containing protein [Treponema sp.]|jgi:hypothetical protein|nr:LysM peptidoglycan-binding domain-containing protein [Treponema sp.]